MRTQNFWKTTFVMGALALMTTGANAQSLVFPQNNVGRIVDLSANVFGPPVVVGPNGIQPYYANPYAYSPYGNAPYANYNPYVYGPYMGNNAAGYYNPYAAFAPNGYYDYNGSIGYPPINEETIPPTEVTPTVNGTPVNGVPLPNAAATPIAAVRARVLPRTSDSIEAHRVRADRFYIGWKGENSAVNKITFAMLDLNKRPIMSRTITQPPGEYTFPITSRMVYYQATVEYINGTTTTVTSPL